MKICYILNKGIVSGPNIVALGNLEKLYELGEDVSVIFLKGDNSIENNYPFLKKINVTYINQSFLKSIFRVKKMATDNAYDIIHSHCFFPDLVNSLSGLNNAKVSTIHNIPHEDYLIRYGRVKGLLLLKVHTCVLYRMTINICISNVVKNSLPSGYHKEVIYNPVRDCFVSSTKKSKYTIVYCGHFSELKNPLSIIDALKKIDLDFYFIGLGDGEILRNCKDLVSNDSRFSFLGRVDNVHDYFSISHCLIHFSKTEGFCLSVVEALVSDMHVITNDLPVFAEIKSLLPENRMYILNNTNSLYECLAFLINSYEPGKHTQTVKSMFSERASAKKHLELYKILTE